MIQWADDIEDDGTIRGEKVFRRSGVTAIKPAAGPQMLPGLSIEIDGRNYVFSHDDPRVVDYLFNFLVVWAGLKSQSQSMIIDIDDS